MGPYLLRFVFFIVFLKETLSAVIPSECPQLSSPTNGKVCYSTAVGSFATYTCNCGYRLIGSGSSLCQPNMTWSHEPPTCQLIDCGSLEIPDNGDLIVTTTTLDSVAMFTCNIGYKMVGNEELVCQENGGWSAEEPICQMIDCGPLETPENGNVVVTTTTLGSVAKFSCTTGFNLVGNEDVICHENGSWSPELPYCESVRVLYHDCMADADICNGLNHAECNGTVCVCSTGYEDPGNNTCVAEECGALVTPENGNFYIVDTLVGIYARFYCNIGYKIVGEEELLCQDIGGWSAEEPICEEIVCGDLPIIPHGTVIMPISPTYNQEASYVCDEGFVISNGEEARFCMADGNWNGTEPTCSGVLYHDCTADADICNGLNHAECNGTVCVCSTGYEDPGNNTCVAEECGALVTPENGNFYIVDTLVGIYARFYCNIGYRIVGEEELLCRDIGGWSAAEPICEEIVCGDLPIIPYGTVIMPISPAYNQEAFYVCDEGYVISNGDDTRFCMADGNWNGTEPTCSDCGPLETPENGNLVLTTTTIGSVAQFSCTTGYELVGDATLVCQENGSWSPEEPYCGIVYCGDLEYIPNGEVIRPGFPTYNQTASYVCDDWYVISSGDETRTCMADGNWNGTQPTCSELLYHNCQVRADICSGPTNTECNGTVCVCSTGFYDPGNNTCVAIDCGPLETPENGNLVLTTTTIGSVAQFSCTTGYELVGDATLVCQENGSWSPEEPYCGIVYCGDLEYIPNGEVIRPGFPTYNQTASYVCDDWYVISSGDETRTCMADGNWNGTQPTCSELLYHNCQVRADICSGPTNTECNGTVCVCSTGFYDPGNNTCVAIDCGSLAIPDNGDLFVANTTLGSVARFECNVGYRMIGNEELVCEGNGGWSSEEPICQIIHCRPLETPVAGNLVMTTTTVGSVARFSCETGTFLVGEEELRCQENGSWSTEEPHCGIAICDPLPSIPHGTVIMPISPTYNQAATYSCDEGYVISDGNETRVCTADGTWSGMEPTCSGCGVLPDIQNGRILEPYNLVADYECNTGFFISAGAKTRYCGDDGVWSGIEPTCSRVLNHNCVAGPDICNELAHAECRDTVCVCSTGSYDPGNGTCVFVDCGPPPAPQNGHVLFEETKYGSAVTYTCNEGFVLFGINSQLCQADGTYGIGPPFCDRIDCGHPGDLINGIVYTPSGTKFQQTAQYTCNTGFILTIGEQTRTCQSDGTWSGPQPECSVFQK